MAGLVNLFRGRAVDVVRVLLVSYPKAWALRALAREAGVSLGWASKVSRALIREKIAIRDSERAELKLVNQRLLLWRWAAYNNFLANAEFIEYYSRQEDISKLFEEFKHKNGPEHAFTTLSGALPVAPFVRPTNAHAYVNSEEDARKWAELAGLMPVEENGNVKFAVVGSKGVFYGAKKINGVKVVSDIQLYVDLLNYPARGAEAAGEIMKTIEKRWKTRKGD